MQTSSGNTAPTREQQGEVFPLVSSVSTLSLPKDIRSLFVSALERIAEAKGVASIQNSARAGVEARTIAFSLGVPRHLSGSYPERGNFQMRLPWAGRIQSQFPASQATGTVGPTSMPASMVDTDTRPLPVGEGKSYHCNCTNKWPAPVPESGLAKGAKSIKKWHKMFQTIKFSCKNLNFLTL